MSDKRANNIIISNILYPLDSQTIKHSPIVVVWTLLYHHCRHIYLVHMIYTTVSMSPAHQLAICERTELAVIISWEELAKNWPRQRQRHGVWLQRQLTTANWIGSSEAQSKQSTDSFGCERVWTIPNKSWWHRCDLNNKCVLLSMMRWMQWLCNRSHVRLATNYYITRCRQGSPASQLKSETNYYHDGLVKSKQRTNDKSQGACN